MKLTPYQQAVAIVKRRFPEVSADQAAEEAHDLVFEWAQERAREQDENGYDDCPSVESCDDAGTGEGRFHGRM